MQRGERYVKKIVGLENILKLKAFWPLLINEERGQVMPLVELTVKRTFKET